MRGKTIKKITKFVDTLILNTPVDQLGNKSRDKLIKEMKTLWKTQGEKGRKFVDFINKSHEEELLK